MEYLCERCLRDDAIHKRDTVCLPVLEVGVDQLLVLLVILDREVKQVEGKGQFLLAVELKEPVDSPELEKELTK